MKNTETQQTSVEQFIQKLEEKAIEETEGLNQIHIVIDVNEYLQLKKQVKEMEKKQIVDGIVESMTKKFRIYTESALEHFIEIAEQHYNKTYGGNK